MGRVASTMRAIADIGSGRLAPDAAMKAISAISRTPRRQLGFLRLPPQQLLWRYRSSMDHPLRRDGAYLRERRRGCAHAARACSGESKRLHSAVLCSASRRIIGGLAVRYDLSSSLRLVAVCPCMVMVPGPHFLNGPLTSSAAASISAPPVYFMPALS